MENDEIPKCAYCKKEIQGYVEKSRLDKNMTLCRSCYIGEMATIAMAKIIKECGGDSINV